jgi:hypothetical protein
MLSRRELITAGVATTVAPVPAEPVQRQGDSEALKQIADNIRDVDGSLERALLSNAVVFGAASKVRAQMETFFRTHLRFPDFVDVGLSVFLDIYDWHIKNRQQLGISRGPDGRYWMQFMFTTVILRGENDPNFVGLPYDKA